MKAFITFIFIGAIIGLGVMLGRGNPAPSASGQAAPEMVSSPVYAGNLPATQATSAVATSPKAQSDTKEPVLAQGGGFSGRLVITMKNGEATEIQSIDVATKEKKVLFSDKTSDQKIQALSQLTPKGDTILMVLGQLGDPAGKLVALKTDGSGQKTTVIEQYVANGSPALSPDQTKMAMVSFANTESNFGFTLSIQDVNGSNRKELVTDENGISNLHFSPDGKQIAFVKGTAITAKEISVVTIATGKVETLYSAKERTVQDLAWGPSGLLTVVTASPEDRTGQTTDVFLVDPKNCSAIQTTKDDETEHAATAAPDGASLAYIKVKTNRVQPGDLTIALPDGKSAAVIGEATDILGWVR